jgi:hypothetical protein
MPRIGEPTAFWQLYETEVEFEAQLIQDEYDYDAESSNMSIDSYSNTSLSSLSSMSSLSSISSLSSMSSISTISAGSAMSEDEAIISEEFDEDNVLETLDQLVPLVVNRRYLLERVHKAKSRDFVDRVLPYLDDYDFKEQYRMFPSSFSVILAKIQNHPVFHTDSNAPRPQEPVHLQLQVALKRLGSESSSASGLSTISKQFGIGKGTVTIYTNRVTTAMMSLWKDTVSWKSSEEKREMRERLVERGIEVYPAPNGLIYLGI